MFTFAVFANLDMNKDLKPGSKATEKAISELGKLDGQKGGVA